MAQLYDFIRSPAALSRLPPQFDICQKKCDIVNYERSEVPARSPDRADGASVMKKVLLARELKKPIMEKSGFLERTGVAIKVPGAPGVFLYGIKYTDVGPDVKALIEAAVSK